MEALQPLAEGQPAKKPPHPDFSKKSFAQMCTNKPQTLTDFPLSVHKGEISIKLSTAAIEKLSVPFKFALVGKFSHGRPSLEETRKSFSKLDLKAALDVGLIDYRHVLMRFHSEADFHRVWTRGIWQIGKYPIRVFKWSPSFQTSKETSIVPVWFELPGLPCHLFEKSVLFSIMKAVGVPISVDAATLILARPSVARVNVEVDLLKMLPSRIWIEHGDDGDGFWQKLVPENLPAYCTSCFRQGHSQEGCSMNEMRVQRTWKTKETDAPLISTLLKRKNPLKDGGDAVVTGQTSSNGQQQIAMTVVNLALEDPVVSTDLASTMAASPTVGASGAGQQEEAAGLAGQQKYTAVLAVSSTSQLTLGANGAGQQEEAAGLAGKQKDSAVVAASSTSKQSSVGASGAGQQEEAVGVAGQQETSVVAGQQPSPAVTVKNHAPQLDSMVAPWQKTNFTETESGLHLQPRKTEDSVMKKVSNDNIIDWDYIFQKISGNILHNNSEGNENLASKFHSPQVPIANLINSNSFNVIEDTILLHGEMNSESNCDFSIPVNECVQGTNENDGTISTPTSECPHVTKIIEGKQMIVDFCATNDCRDNGAVLKPFLEVEDRNTELQLAWKNLLLSSQNAPGINDLSYTLPRTESAPLLRIHWLDKESPEPEIPDIDAHDKSLYLDDGQGDNTMVKVQFQEQVIQNDTPVKTSRYNLRSLSKAEISEIQNSKKNKKKEARRNALEFNYSDSDTHIDVNIV